MLNGLLGAIAVRFGRQEHQTHRSAIAADRFIHALRLNGEGAVVVVRFAMDQQQRALILLAYMNGDILR